jgi:type II secretory pathway pseudopilin PulG
MLEMNRIPNVNSSRRGFSFAEVMFAVVILGIGFIMVAAIFPVAIQQTQASSEESSAAATAREAADAIASLPGTVPNPIYISGSTTGPQSQANLLVFPPTVKNYVIGSATTTSVPIPSAYQSLWNGGIGTLQEVTSAPPATIASFVGTRWNLLNGNVILPSDPRYAYVPFYRRESGSSFAQSIVIAATNRNRPIYTAFPDEVVPTQRTNPTVTTTAGLASQAQQSKTMIYPDTITLSSSNIFPQEGYYVTTPPAPIPLAAPPPNPQPANRTYRLGRQLTGTPYGPGTFEIAPGDTMELTASSSGWGTIPPSSPSSGTAGIFDTPVNSTLMSDAIFMYLYSTSTLQPTVAYAAIRSDPNSPGGRIQLVQLPPGPSSSFTAFNLASFNSNNAAVAAAAAPGAFIIIADDYPYDGTSAMTMSSTAGYALPPNLLPPTAYAGAPPTFAAGALNGRIFRLGTVATTDDNGNAYPPGVYNLDPQYGMRPPSTQAGAPNWSPDTVPNPALTMGIVSGIGPPLAKVYIVGMGRSNPNSTLGQPGAAPYDQSYSGAAQDVGVFSSYFQVK